MDTLTTAPVVTGTSLEVLQAYPLGTLSVKVVDFAPSVRSVLVGIDLSDNKLSPCLVAFYNRHGISQGTGRYKPEQLTPILRPFSQLCEPLEYCKASPIKHVIELQLDLVCDPKRHVKFENGWIWFDRHGEGDWRPLYHEDWFRSGKMSLATAEYLRHHHFAVGLEPHQYIPKTNQI